MLGIVTKSGIALQHNGHIVPLAPTLTPLGAALAELLASGVEPCPVCDRYSCDCDEWHEIMFTDPTDPDPHGDLRALQAMELPY